MKFLLERKIMKILLIVIATNIVTGKDRYFIQEYSSMKSCEIAKKNVKTVNFKTWRFCI